MRSHIPFLLMTPLLAISSLKRWIPFSFVAPVLALSSRWAQAKVYLSQEEALAKAFPGALQVERKTLFLTPEQVREIEKRARARIDSQVHSYYVGRGVDGPMGAAFFETRIVRTMPMTLMTVVKPDGTVAFVEVLAFHEPEDYFPRLAWLRLYGGRRLTDDLRLRRAVPNVTGASLTCQAINDGIRLTLALHQVAVQGSL